MGVPAQGVPAQGVAAGFAAQVRSGGDHGRYEDRGNGRERAHEQVLEGFKSGGDSMMERR